MVVTRMRNMFEEMIGSDPLSESIVFPAMVVNTKFRPNDDAELSTEIQIHLHEVLECRKQHLKFVELLSAATAEDNLGQLFEK